MYTHRLLRPKLTEDSAMNKLLFALTGLFLLAGQAATAQAVNVNASCGCEHFASQYDQFCEATPQFAPPTGHFLYRYIWTADDPRVVINPSVSTGPTTVATCVGGSGCRVKLTVRVEAVDSFYYPIQNFVYGADTAVCASGTPNPGGGPMR